MPHPVEFELINAAGLIWVIIVYMCPTVSKNHPKKLKKYDKYWIGAALPIWFSNGEICNFTNP